MFLCSGGVLGVVLTAVHLLPILLYASFLCCTWLARPGVRCGRYIEGYTIQNLLPTYVFCFVALAIAMAAMPFQRYVEIGRVALVNYGKEYRKLVVIVDVIDQNWALVEAPDMVRGQMNFKRLSLTDIKIDIPRIPKKSKLIAGMDAADAKNKCEKSSWGRKLIVQKKRAELNDFDRFKKPMKIHSRSRDRQLVEAKRKGRHSGYGKHYGTREARLPSKVLWMRRMRVLRHFLRKY
ncbi:hypothetical protein IEQ34_000048 [Dendrobium chrysotoxum]|uniref:Large ribosomal subunit protein eL19 domain-containing protein n=1 Tax=Dendrobium chrysotoxum TaxID=161865 RepID=A0AAV7H813_DENCH|nr:hypothetical protein IEQ34_000048 [Dendrobium chrysotoxum]